MGPVGSGITGLAGMEWLGRDGLYGMGTGASMFIQRVLGRKRGCPKGRANLTTQSPRQWSLSIRSKPGCVPV
jgi:hypothetical protein